MDWDDEPRSTKAPAAVGDKLDGLSIADLQQRIEDMRAEIVRLETEIKSRETQQDIASSIFKS